MYKTMFQVFMGIFYHFRAVALAEDIPGIEEGFETVDAFYAAANRGYDMVRALWQQGHLDPKRLKRF